MPNMYIDTEKTIRAEPVIANIKPNVLCPDNFICTRNANALFYVIDCYRRIIRELILLISAIKLKRETIKLGLPF